MVVPIGLSMPKPFFTTCYGFVRLSMLLARSIFFVSLLCILCECGHRFCQDNEHVDGYLQEETAKNEERIVENNIQMMKVNDTLEQDMVENITPLIPRAHGDPTYAPVADKKHNASEANGNTMLDI